MNSNVIKKVRGVIVFCKNTENFIYLKVDHPLVHQVTSSKKGIVKEIASLINNSNLIKKDKGKLINKLHKIANKQKDNEQSQ